MSRIERLEGQLKELKKSFEDHRDRCERHQESTQRADQKRNDHISSLARTQAQQATTLRAMQPREWRVVDMYDRQRLVEVVTDTEGVMTVYSDGCMYSTTDEVMIIHQQAGAAFDLPVLMIDPAFPSDQRLKERE